MFANERQDKINELVEREGAVTTSRLVKIFGVSVETIRRDLVSMELDGRLTRVHGGAVKKGSMKEFRILTERNSEHEEEKHNLSQKAVEFISDGDVIAIDSGSTAVSFARELKDRFDRLTIITHSLDVFNVLCDREGYELILCAGHFLKSENSFYGPLTLGMIDSLHVRKAFVFPSAVSLKHGVSDFQTELYQVQKKLTQSADEVYILADSSKFEQNGMLKLGDINSGYTYITDSRLPKDLQKLYEENGIKVYMGDEK